MRVFTCVFFQAVFFSFFFFSIGGLWRQTCKICESAGAQREQSNIKQNVHIHVPILDVNEPAERTRRGETQIWLPAFPHLPPLWTPPAFLRQQPLFHGGFATHPRPLRRCLHFLVLLQNRCRLRWKWDLPLFSKALLNESSKPAGIGWAGEHPRDCLAEAARPRFIHRNVGMLASPFIHTQRISFTFCSFASRF